MVGRQNFEGMFAPLAFIVLVYDENQMLNIAHGITEQLAATLHLYTRDAASGLLPEYVKDLPPGGLD